MNVFKGVVRLALSRGVQMPIAPRRAFASNVLSRRLDTLVPPSRSWQWNAPMYALARRTLFIQTQSVPNPRSLKFVPGKEVLSESGLPSLSFDATDKSAAKKRSPLAWSILLIDGVTNVMFGKDFVTVTIGEGVDWMVTKPHVFAAISDAFASSEPVVLSAEAASEAPTSERVVVCKPEDLETVSLIKEIVDNRIRPSVMEDGGDVELVKYENNIVYLLMKGSCSGCPSSSVTLKHGIQNMLMHYVEEVKGVEEWIDAPLETVSAEALSQLEAGLQKVAGSPASGASAAPV